jgi:hypothetical protein
MYRRSRSLQHQIRRKQTGLIRYPHYPGYLLRYHDFVLHLDRIMCGLWELEQVDPDRCYWYVRKWHLPFPKPNIVP